MTADTHERATDRTEEAVENMDLGLADDDFVLMVQGDEVLVNPDMTGVIVQNYRDNRPDVASGITALPGRGSRRSQHGESRLGAKRGCAVLFAHRSHPGPVPTILPYINRPG